VRILLAENMPRKLLAALVAEGHEVDSYIPLYLYTARTPPKIKTWYLREKLTGFASIKILVGAVEDPFEHGVWGISDGLCRSPDLQPIISISHIAPIKNSHLKWTIRSIESF
jgi:hypothetical protein